MVNHFVVYLNYVSLRTYEQLAGFEVLMTVTMKNVILWDVKPQFVLHRKHITSLLQSLAS
jgi:hypothetical protein